MSSVLARQYTNIAALVLLVYDQTITWDKELNRVWRSRDWVLKILFFIGRYGALAFQIINLLVTRPYVLENQLISCHKFYGFQVLANNVFLINFQLILMIRVYALYDRSIKMACFLACWFTCYTSVMFLSTTRMIPLLKLDSSCMVMDMPPAGAVISFSVMCTLDQFILWGLTAWKYRDAISHGWSTNPILRLIMRDTSWSCLAICAMILVTAPYHLMKGKHLGHIVCSLLCAMLSISASRTILNMRGLCSSNGPLSIDVSTMDLELTELTPSE